MKRLIQFVFIVGLFSACAPMEHSSTGFKTDMKQFLDEQGIVTDDLKCSMLGNGVNVGPEAYCLITLSNADVNNLATRFDLRHKTDIAVSWQPTGADCWTRLDFHDPTASAWYISADDSPNLKMANGTELDYFRLFYKEDSAEGCISTAYVS